MERGRTQDFIEETTGYWQRFEEAGWVGAPPFKYGFPARLPDGRILLLPIRRRSADRAIASFIANHASFEVLDALAEHMAAAAAAMRAEAIIGLPTLGLALAPLIAQRLGQANFVPFGTSRKFWYDERLSQPLRSITTTQEGRRLYVDPNLVPRLQGRRAIIVDDTISSGATALAAIKLALAAGADVVGLSFAMSQGDLWREALAELGGEWVDAVSYVFESPHLILANEGWTPIS
jgi:adenine/guanine phosphoribosyltransferase-like PRPP-binding protein